MQRMYSQQNKEKILKCDRVHSGIDRIVKVIIIQEN